MRQAEEDIELPPKVVNLGRVPTAQNNVPVQLNGFKMNLDKAVEEIYQFEIRFWGLKTVKPKGQEEQIKEQDLGKGPRNDESKETRRRLLWQLFHQLIVRNPDFFDTKNKRIFTYDCGLLLFCTQNLGLEVGSPAHEFMLDHDPADMEERCRAYMRRIDRVRVTILRTGTVNLRNASAAYIQGDRSVVQFLEILTSQRIFEKGEHYCFGNRMYEVGSNIVLHGDPRVLKEGMQKNVRFVGETQDNAGPILQLDAKKSAFFPDNMNMVQYVCEFMGTNANNLQRELRDNRFCDRINKQIKGIIVITTHMDTPIVFQNMGMFTETPAQHTFQRNGDRVTVQRHIEETYRMRLRYPDLPCIIQRKPQTGDSYYPMEVLNIYPGQRVSIDKQTSSMVEQMIKQCQVLPADVPDAIRKQQVQSMAQSANPFFQAHGVRVDSELIRSNAQQLHLPAILYANNDKAEPEAQGGLTRSWKMLGPQMARRNFLEAAEFPKTWAVIIVQNCVPFAACRDFCQSFVRTANQRGLTDCRDPPRVDNFEQTDMEYVGKKFEFYANNKCMFVLCFAPGKRDRGAGPGDIHHVLKFMEQKYEVLTQHISPGIMQKGVGGGGGAAMVVENIMMKTNLKLGGANYALTSSNMFKQAARSQQDTLGEVWLGGKRMFMGIDFSHAPPQSLFDRKSGKAPAIPSVVGMSWTVGKKMLKMRGTYWMQQTRTTTMKEQFVFPLIENIRQAIMQYQAENDHFPDHIIVFRGGASEGEFKRIAFWEGNSFVQAFKQLLKQFGAKFQPPAVTLVICQRQSNYRVIPTNINPRDKAPEQNVQPGTVVDKGVMNAALTEFLLVAHRALQGTAQPVRCTVIYEFRPDVGPAKNFPPQIPLEELENITNALCWSHGIFTGATALPGVLYAAGELAKRGRNNWKMNTQDGADVPLFDMPQFGQEGAEEAEAAQQQVLDDQRAQYFGQVSEHLKPKIATKFWA